MQSKGISIKLCKGLLFLVCLFISTHLIAQSAPPANLTGSALRTWLVDNWYDGYHTTLGYSGVNGARSYMYNIIDNESNYVTCVYSGHQEYRLYDINRTAGTSNMLPINCEHTIPQSFFNENEPMKSDIHHLFPTYDVWNSTRSNKPLGEIDDNETDKWMYLNTSTTAIPGSNIDLYSESKTGFFEPREDHKGNIARAIFYFYTMYPTEAGDMSLVGDINTFFAWHLADPVDADEIARNEAVGTYQGNKNPYISHPELVEKAWTVSNPGPNISATTSTSDIQINWDDLSTETGYSVYRSIDNISFTQQGSTLAANTITYTDVNVVESTTYYYYVDAHYADGSTVSGDTITTQLSPSGGGANASDLFISEYVEGSGFNKSIEIANFTGGPIDLSNYELGKQVNGAGGWTNISLSGTLADQSVYVITNNSTTNTDLIAKTDLLSSSTVLDFNGNDPVALFSTAFAPAMIIDIVGTESGGSSNFAKDKTLVRNASVSTPNDLYTTAEWTTYSQNYIDDVGVHTFGSTLPVTLLNFDAIAEKDYNQINWKTTQEINHDYFILEHSNDGITFKSLATIQHSNVSNINGAEYHYKDITPFKTTYYRLVQVDLDGTTGYFETKVVQRSTHPVVLDIYPVPANNYINIDVKFPKAELVRLHILDTQGKLMIQQSMELINGRNLIQLPITQLSAGMYVVKLLTDEEQLISKFVKRNTN